MANKPLNRKNYGSIAHLPGSRMGPGDHHCHEGQARIACERTRDRHDVVIATEKLDGSNVGVARLGGKLFALTRAGYLADTSPHEQHHRFARWVEANERRFLSVLNDGERLVGEWLIQAHSTRYALPHEPFVALDLMVDAQRLPYEMLLSVAGRAEVVTPRLLHQGGAFGLEQALDAVVCSGHGALDVVEGVVWRVERRGVVDFLVKYVRPDKIDGIYLPEISREPPVWNTWKGDS